MLNPNSCDPKTFSCWGENIQLVILGYGLRRFVSLGGFFPWEKAHPVV